MSLPTSSFLFVIESSDDLIGLALGLGLVVQLSYLVNSSNNQAPLSSASSFLAMSADNAKLSDDLVGPVLGLGMCGAAINQPKVTTTYNLIVFSHIL